MSINFRKGSRVSPSGKLLVPSLPYPITVDSTTATIPDESLGVYVQGFQSPAKIPHQIIAPLYASRVSVDLDVTGGAIARSVVTTLNAGRTRVINIGGDDDGGSQFNSIHAAFDSPDATRNTVLAYDITEGGSRLQVSLILPTFARPNGSVATYYAIPNLWKLDFSLTGLLQKLDEDDLVEEQWSLSTGTEFSDNLSVFGAPFGTFAEAGISGSITVAGWLGDGS